MKQTTPEQEYLSQAIALFDAAADCDTNVNIELLEQHNLKYSYHSSGDFCPLTERELSLLHYGEGFKLSGGASTRFNRMFLIQGEKVINISDDDYMTSECDSERVESFHSNAAASTKVYKEIANAFGVEFHWTCDVNQQLGHTEYFADIYIPVKVFDFIKDDVEFANYFLERKYLTCIHAKQFKESKTYIDKPLAPYDLFLQNTPKGKEFGFNASETGSHNEDGTVTFNDNGQAYYTYQSIEDFANQEFNNVDVVHLVSSYVGDRTENGQIVWFNTPYKDCELDDEDGSCVYTKPKLYANIDKELLEDINNSDAFDLLELILKKPELLSEPLTLELLRRRDIELKEMGI